MPTGNRAVLARAVHARARDHRKLLQHVLSMAVLAIAAAGCAVESGDSRLAVPAASTGVSTSLSEVSVLGEFTHRDLKESSSAVPSRRTPGVFWTHNDAGNDERLFAFDSTGRDLGTVRVRGSRNRDWEAMAIGPCDEGVCLYIGDVGDNLREQKSVTVFRLAEPSPPGYGRAAGDTVNAILRFQYPDGAHDVEAMWVAADTSLWLATKRRLRDASGRNRPSLVYRVPASAWRANIVAVAELVDSLPIVPTNNPSSMVTDAAYSAPFAVSDGEPRLAVRTYDRLLVFTSTRAGRPGTLLAECSLEDLNEVQGEGIAWLPDGRVLLTSEKRGAPVHAARCP